MADARKITDAAVNLGILAAQAGLRAIALVPRRVLLFAGMVLGDVLYATYGRRRRYVLNNLKLAFGREKSAAELVRIARASYRHFCQGLVEMMASVYGPPESIDRIVKLEGPHVMEQAFAYAKGVILICAHIGNWEICACKRDAFSRPVYAIARPPRNPRVGQLMQRARAFATIRVLSTRTTYRELLDLLRAGNPLIFLFDVNAGKQGAFVEFFGRFASTHRSSVALALDSGATVVLGMARRLPDGTHAWKFSPPFALTRTGDRERDLLRNTAAITKAIEQQIRSCPEQYYWFHRRWKQRPAWESPETK